jgi:UDP-GlcNAc:undecaprenyl-phosphate GlcNAc-1-phosphate transferase
MLLLLYFGGTFVLSLGLALYLTPILRRGAMAFDVLDKPDGRLKSQPVPVPYLGGIAVYLAFLIALSLVFEFRPQLLGLLLGGTMVAMLGLFDDLKILAPRLKLAGQLLAAWVMLRSDISIQLEAVPLEMATLLTIVWLVGVTNAVNILDVSDGLAAGVSAIAALSLFVIAVLNGDVLIGTTTLALVGALVGFLRYNQPPARIYLGDTGSLFVGFMLAALAMIGAYTRRSEIAAFAPVAVLIVPILETTLVVFARLAEGRSPFKGSPDHLALRLKLRGLSAGQVAWVGYGLGLVGGVVGIATTLVNPTLAAVLLGCMAALAFGMLVWLWRLPAPQQPEAEDALEPLLPPAESAAEPLRPPAAHANHQSAERTDPNQ